MASKIEPRGLRFEMIREPFVTFITGKLLIVVGVDVSKIKRPVLTEDEVRTCIKMGWDEGAITAEERRMLSRVFTLNDKKISETEVMSKK